MFKFEYFWTYWHVKLFKYVLHLVDNMALKNFGRKKHKSYPLKLVILRSYTDFGNYLIDGLALKRFRPMFESAFESGG